MNGRHPYVLVKQGYGSRAIVRMVICSLRMQVHSVTPTACCDVDKRWFSGNPEQRSFVKPGARRGRSNGRSKGDGDEDRNSQIMLDELNMRRQKQFELLTRKADLLRTHGNRGPMRPFLHDSLPDPKDSRSLDVANALHDSSLHDDSPLLHRSESILRSYSDTALSAGHSPAPAQTKTFRLSYEVLETRATSVVVTVNSTVSATVWCRAQLPEKPVDATALRMNHRGRNVQSRHLAGLRARRRGVLPGGGTAAGDAVRGGVRGHVGRGESARGGRAAGGVSHARGDGDGCAGDKGGRGRGGDGGGDAGAAGALRGVRRES